MAARTAEVTRSTKETRIAVSINVDGTGKSEIATGVGFFDHMLDQLSRHSLIDMKVHAEGDLHIDDHHTVEDTGIALGQALSKALGERRGIMRYASIDLAMDETLTRAAVDVSGRPYLVWNVLFSAPKIGKFRHRTGARVLPRFRAECRHNAACRPISTAPTTIISPKPVSRRWRACCVRRSNAIRASPMRFRPPRAV